MDKTAEAVDVVIVGSGAGGSIFAAELAEAGKKVLILERGRDRKLTDLYSSQVWARRLKWGAHTVAEDGPDVIGYNFHAGHGVGGAAMHHQGVWPRYHEEDFKMRSLYKRGIDWPFDYQDLRAEYDQIQEEVGISGDAAQEIWRPPGAPYPLPPVAVFNQGHVLKRGFDALNIHLSPPPYAILTQPYKGRPACIYDGWCDAGCPTGALANPLVTHLPRAYKAGAVTRTDASVTRVLMDKTGKRAIGVEYYTSDNTRVFQPAAAVVLCAFVVENCRILMNSGDSNHPDGLANSSGMLGRYLTAHLAVVISGMFKEDMQNYLGVSAGQLFSQHSFNKTGDPNGGFGSRQWSIALALKPNDLLGFMMFQPSVFGNDLHKFMQEGSRSIGAMVATCEDTPLPENRIARATQTDKWGMPIVNLVHESTLENKKVWATARQEGIDVFKAAGAKQTWTSPQVAQHMMGGTVMGKDPKTSVLNGYAQAHDVGNLFIGGPSAFPTSSCVNTTYTTLALGLRTTRYMLQNWGNLQS